MSLTARIAKEVYSIMETERTATQRRNSSDRLDRFKTFYLVLDDMIAESGKEDLVECARVLALNLAQYKQVFGELPEEGYKKLRTAKSIDEKTPKLVASGMLEMAIALAKATGRLDKE